jgi:hypothetical protein
MSLDVIRMPKERLQSITNAKRFQVQVCCFSSLSSFSLMGGGTLLFGEDAGALELELRNGPCPSIEANDATDCLNAVSTVSVDIRRPCKHYDAEAMTRSLGLRR